MVRKLHHAGVLEAGWLDVIPAKGVATPVSSGGSGEVLSSSTLSGANRFATRVLPFYSVDRQTRLMDKVAHLRQERLWNWSEAPHRLTGCGGICTSRPSDMTLP